MAQPIEHVEIRPYEPTDQVAFACLVTTVLVEYGLTVDPVLEGDLEHPDTSYQSVWVAVYDGRVVGSVAIRLIDDGAAAELKRMYLQPEFRGRGLGRALLNHAIDWAKQRRCRSIVLDTSTAMTSAQRLYESAGFVRSGTRTEMGAHGSRCELLYKLDLASSQSDYPPAP